MTFELFLQGSVKQEISSRRQSTLQSFSWASGTTYGWEGTPGMGKFTAFSSWYLCTVQNTAWNPFMGEISLINYKYNNIYCICKIYYYYKYNNILPSPCDPTWISAGVTDLGLQVFFFNFKLNSIFNVKRRPKLYCTFTTHATPNRQHQNKNKR